MAGLVIKDAYILWQTFRFPDGTDSSRLRRTFDSLFDHANGDMLRKIFVFEPTENRYLQVTMKPGSVSMDWSTETFNDEESLQQAVAEYEKDHASEPFVEGEIWSRLRLFELNGSPKALVWTLHHASVDHWSLNNMASDLEAIYNGEELPTRRPFKPMVKYLQTIDRQASMNFWKSKLSDASPSPFLLPRPGAPRLSADSSIVREVSVQFSSLARQGVMASTLVTTAWSIVLATHTGATDVVFGQVLVGRSEYI